MTTRQISNDVGQPGLPTANILGIILFLLGAPHLYAFLKRPTGVPRQTNTGRYAMVVLLAGLFAGLLELSVF